MAVEPLLARSKNELGGSFDENMSRIVVINDGRHSLS
jgi:hypothetical protein